MLLTLLPIGVHWSSLELKILDECWWSPLESIGVNGVGGVRGVRTEKRPPLDTMAFGCAWAQLNKTGFSVKFNFVDLKSIMLSTYFICL